MSELSVRCPLCAASAGSPCVALGNSRYRRRGEPILGFHVKRTMLLREQAAPTPPTRTREETTDG